MTPLRLSPLSCVAHSLKSGLHSWSQSGLKVVELVCDLFVSPFVLHLDVFTVHLNARILDQVFSKRIHSAVQGYYMLIQSERIRYFSLEVHKLHQNPIPKTPSFEIRTVVIHIIST